MVRLNANNLSSTTLDGSITSSDTSISVTDASVFPSAPFRATIDDGSSVEIVEVTSVSSNTLTVERGKENTSGTGFADGVPVAQRFTAGMYSELVADGETDVIGSTELDTSVGYSFSSQIDFTGGIGGGGSTIDVQDTVRLEDSNNVFLEFVETGTTGNDFRFNKPSSTELKVQSLSGDDFLTIGFDLNVHSRGITNSGPIDNGGSAIPVNDPINLANSDSIQDAGTDAIQFDGSENITIPNGNLDIKQNKITENGTTVFDITSDTIDIPEKPLRITASNPFPELQLSSNNEFAGVGFKMKDEFRDKTTNIVRNHGKSELLISSIDSGTTTDTFALKDDGDFNLVNSGSIQDSGTDAIQFDGSANVTIPNMDTSTLNNNNFIKGEITTGGSSQLIGLGSGDVAIVGDVGGNGIPTRIRSDGNEAIQVKNDQTVNHVNNDSFNIAANRTQPGSSTTPSIGIGDGGAGFFINSSGEVVVVDEAGNTTTIS